MKKSLFWLGVTLAGSAVSIYGNIKVREAVREEAYTRLNEGASPIRLEDLGYTFDGTRWTSKA